MSGLKNHSFNQGIYHTSHAPKELVGTQRIVRDGRKFRYTKAGANISAGKLQLAAKVGTGLVNNTGIVAAIGTKVLNLTIGSSTVAENYLKGGFMHINDADGQGHVYEIDANTAVSAGTSILITLKDGLRVVMAATSEFTLVHSPYMGTVESAVEENLPVGVAPVDVTSGHYYWSQTSGPAICLAQGALAIGARLVPGTVAGSIAVQPTITVNTTSGVILTPINTLPVVGTAWAAVGVGTEYAPIVLNLE